MKNKNQYKYILIVSFIELMFMLFAQNNLYAKTVYHKDLLPIVPRIIGMGDGFTAQASGLYSLWTNPAGLSKKFVNHLESNSEVTAFAFSFWVEPYPQDVSKFFNNFMSKNIEKSLSILNTTGIAFGFPIYGGYLIQNHWGSLGFGIANSFDTDVYTPDSFYSVQTLLVDQFQFMAGYSYQFYVSDFFIRLGATVRPLFRTYNGIKGSEVNTTLLRSGDMSKVVEKFDGLHGFAIGQDVGLQIEWRGISLGVDIHNIFTPIFYTEANTVDYFSGSAKTLKPDNYFVLPLYLNLGIAYNLSSFNNYTFLWLEEYFDFTVYLQFTDPFYLSYLEYNRRPNFASRVHMGIEFEVLKPFVKMQLGFNKGGPTFGMGFDIWVVDISFALYTQESGEDIRERTTPGFVLETAFRW